MSPTTHRTSLSDLPETAKRKMEAFMVINANALGRFREFFGMRNYLEIASASLADITGSSLTGTAKTSPTSADVGVQLSSLVECFRRSYFSVLNTNPNLQFGEDQRFALNSTSVCVSTLFTRGTKDEASDFLLNTIEEALKFAVIPLLEDFHHELFTLGCDLNHLSRVARRPFIKIRYQEAQILHSKDAPLENGTTGSISPRQERELLSSFCNIPVFITEMPQEHSTILLLPKLGRSAEGFVAKSRSVSAKPSSEQGASGSGTGPARLGFLSKSKDDFHAGFSLSFDRFLGFLLGTSIF